MEQIHPQVFKHNLDKVLKSYQTVAMSSLGGPSSYARWAGAAGGNHGEAMGMAIARKLAGLESPTAAAVAASASVHTMPSPVAVTGSTDVVAVAASQQQHMAGLAASALSKPPATDGTPQMTSPSAVQPSSSKSLKYLEFDAMLNPPPFPIQQIPVFTPIDQSSGEKCDTVLESEFISCFIVGGEKRLCLPQILNSVLRDFSLQEINVVCEDLLIYCSRCSPEQLEILKCTRILPVSAPSCGLITKTDAERLCNMLLYGLSDTKQYTLPSPRSKHGMMLRENCFTVYHECFGKCKGLFVSDLYVDPQAPCIECLDCQYLFTPQKFVMHSHKGRENRTCHWGFDSANWRSYLLLVREQELDEKFQAALSDMKAKFDLVSRFKRKHCVDENGNTKKIKIEDDIFLTKDAIVTSAWCADGLPLQRPSAFRPWSPSSLAKEHKGLPEHGTVLVRDSRGIPTYLSMGPPVLLNPERVVPHTAASNYDSHYAPNVTLAPPSKPEMTRGDGTKDSSSESRSPESRDSPGSKRPEESSPSDSSSMEQEIEMVRSMLLDGDAVETRPGREKLLRELARIRLQQEEKYRSAEVARRNCQQELEFVRASKKEKLREAAELKRNLRKDYERLRSDYERKFREMSDSKHHLKQELELLRGRRTAPQQQQPTQQDAAAGGKERARLRAENKYMRERLEAVEGERDVLKRQLSRRRNEEDHHETKAAENQQRRPASTEKRENSPGMSSP